MVLTYPELEPSDVVDQVDGLSFRDPYRALEFGQHDHWAQEQAAFARAYLDGLPFREKAEHSIRRLFELDRRTVPAARPAGLFQLRWLPGQDQPSLVLRSRATGVETTVIDPGAEDGARALSSWSVDPRGRWLAYQLTESGAGRGPLVVRDLNDPAGPRERVLVADVRRPMTWWDDTSDQPTLYVGCDGGKDDPHQRLVAFDALSGESVVVWEPLRERGPCFLSPIGRLASGPVLVSMRRGADPANELWLVTPGDGRCWISDTVPVLARRTGTGGVVLAMNARDDRPGGVAYVPTGDLAPESWSWLDEAQPDEQLLNVAVTRSHAIVLRVRNGAHELSILALDGSTSRRVPPPSDLGVVSGLTADLNGDTAWFEFSGVVQPHTLYELDTITGDAASLDPDVGPARPVISYRRESCRSADGLEIDLTIVAPTDPGTDARAGVLAVYGGFGRSIQTTYRSDMVLWLLSGGTYAVAHVRGGGERGSAWHRQGRGSGKRHAIEDLIAAAEHLVATGTVDARRLAVTGVSNGGLLASSAAVLRPDLFAACIPLAPVTDLARFHLFGDGACWRSEYGDPDSAIDLKHLLPISPYHCVRRGISYPAFLISVGTNDQRVTPIHARKLCAALQACTANEPSRRPVLLREDGRYGHESGSARSRIEYGVDQAVFLWDQLGLAAPPPTGSAS